MSRGAQALISAAGATIVWPHRPVRGHAPVLCACAVASALGPCDLSSSALNARHERPRQQIGADHRKGHGQGHRPEQELAHARHQRQRSQHQERAERRNQLGHGHFAGPQKAASFGSSAEAQMAVGVFQADDRAIDQRPDRQRQAGQRHHVDRHADCVQADDRSQHRDGNRGDRDQRHPPFAQEEQDHQRAENRPQHPLLDQGRDRRRT